MIDGFRKLKTSKTIHLLPDENSDEDHTNDKKQVVTQQINKLKKESKQELDEILQSGQLNWTDKYKHVKSKYLINKNNPSTYHPSIMTSGIQSPKYKSAPVTTTNKYKPIITESKVNKDERKKKLNIKVNSRLISEIDVDDDEDNKEDFYHHRSDRNNMITMFTSGDFYYM